VLPAVLGVHENHHLPEARVALSGDLLEWARRLLEWGLSLALALLLQVDLLQVDQ